MPVDNRQIIILHIPKTAGTSLRKLVQRNYKKEECFFVYTRNSRFQTVDDFMELDQGKKGRLKIIMGHLPFNPHLYAGMDPVYVTILRDPVERVISYYNHVMTRKDGWTSRNVSLLKYLEESDDLQLWNHQTRILSGLNEVVVNSGHLEAAKNNLENHFIFAGLSEMYAESIARLSALLNWSDTTIFRENTSKGRHGAGYYSKSEIQRIADMNQYDIELYNHVKAGFLSPSSHAKIPT